MFPFPLSHGCRSHLGAPHQSKTHHKVARISPLAPSQPLSWPQDLQSSKTSFQKKEFLPQSSMWRPRELHVQHLQDGARQETCREPPAPAAATAPSRDVTASKEEPWNAAHPAHPLRQGEKPHTCGCAGGEGKLEVPRMQEGSLSPKK